LAFAWGPDRRRGHRGRRLALFARDGGDARGHPARPAELRPGRAGPYLVIAGDCESCHDDQETGHPFAGGRAIETPFGNVVAANVTPDPKTGIGDWSDAEFVRALREGKSPHGLSLYPAMPYPYYTRLTEADALAIRAYLNTVKPVRHAGPRGWIASLRSQ